MISLLIQHSFSIKVCLLSLVQFPDEQFFHTDYRPLMWDRDNNVLDEQVSNVVIERLSVIK